MSVEEQTIELEGSPVFLRRAPAPGTPPVFLHDIPVSSAVWQDVLASCGGLAPDLPGFGRSGKGGQLDLTPQGHADFLEQLLDAQGLGQVQLVVHGWGAAGGLIFAQRHPHRVEQLVLVAALPLLEGFRWARMARIWRTPVLGELVMGSVTARLLARALRRSAVNPEAWSENGLRDAWQGFDQGTQRAILRLHRAADERSLAEAGAELDGLTMPTLILWGEDDPWLDASWARAYARRLPQAELAIGPASGHWPWLEDPSMLERIVARLT